MMTASSDKFLIIYLYFCSHQHLNNNVRTSFPNKFRRDQPNLGKLHPIFEHLPVENMVHTNQQEYYNAIAVSTKLGQSGPFIDFMLREILQTLKTHQVESIPNKVPNKLKLEYPELTENTWSVYAQLKRDGNLSAAKIGAILGLSDRLIRKHIAFLKEAGIIEREGSNKSGHWKIIV